MEPEVREFLKRVAFTLFAGLVWLITNVSAGLFSGWLFFQHRPSIGNFIYYIWLAGSLCMLILISIRLWKNKLH